MTILRLCPFMERNTHTAVAWAAEFPPAQAVEHLDAYLFGCVDFINKVIDGYAATSSDVEETKRMVVETLLSRWDDCRRLLRDIRFTFWMEKWFPGVLWVAGNNN